MAHIQIGHDAHMNESFHTCACVLSHTQMSHVMSHTNDIIHLKVPQIDTPHRDRCYVCEGAMSHAWISHVTRMNEACHRNEWGMSHMWISHVKHINKSCHAYEWVKSHTWLSHGTQKNETCTPCTRVASYVWMHVYRWAMSYIWMSHVTHMNESRHTYEGVTSHIWMSHVTNEDTCAACSKKKNEPHRDRSRDVCDTTPWDLLSVCPRERTCIDVGSSAFPSFTPWPWPLWKGSWLFIGRVMSLSCKQGGCTKIIRNLAKNRYFQEQHPSTTSSHKYSLDHASSLSIFFFRYQIFSISASLIHTLSPSLFCYTTFSLSLPLSFSDSFAFSTSHSSGPLSVSPTPPSHPPPPTLTHLYRLSKLRILGLTHQPAAIDGVATISRLLKMIGLFCNKDL